MGALAQYLEAEGLSTTQISLIRLHTEKIKPPRALWVSFELGRPLGVPNDPEFQTRVLKSALSLLEAPSGPVLEDFPEDAPTPPGQAAWACPISLPEHPLDLNEMEKLKNAFLAEIAQLATWYDLSQKERGRTTVGVSQLSPSQIGELLAGFLDGEEPANPRPEVDLPWLVKLATEDLKAYYFEAATAKPGQGDPGSDLLAEWFWGETSAGLVFMALRNHFLKSDNPWGKLLAKMLLIPTSQGARAAQFKSA